MASKVGLVLVAVAAAAAGVLVLSDKKASAQSGIPPAGWNPPSTAVFKTSAGNANPTTLSLNSWTWRDQGALGLTTLVTNAANPQNDFCAFFTPDGSAQAAILTVGTTPNSGLIAQAGVAGMLK